MVALLVSGSAILLISCDGTPQPEAIDEESVVAKYIDSMTVIVTVNGKRTQRFYTPLREDYEFAREPFEEYRKGIEVSSYDSLEVETSNIVADYALYWTKRDLWELKGNVVVVSRDADGERTLFSQQLFWDRKIKRIYSNVDSKVEEGGDVFIGEGFEADDDFKRWTFRRLKGQVGLDTEPAQKEPQSAEAQESGESGEPQAAAVPTPSPPSERDGVTQVSAQRLREDSEALFREPLQPRMLTHPKDI